MGFGASEDQLLKAKQEAFSESIKAKILEDKGSKLIDFTDKETIKTGGQYTFYRFGQAESTSDSMNMYDPNYKGDAGEAEQIMTDIKFLYASDRVANSSMNSTSLNLKSSFVNTLSSAINRKVDKFIISEVDKLKGNTILNSNKSECLITGDYSKTLDDVSNIDALVEACVLISTLAREDENNEDPDVAIVVTAKEYAKLNRIEKISNKYDFYKKGRKGTLFGCKVIRVPENVKGGWTGAGSVTDAPSVPGTAGIVTNQLILIPRGAVGTVSHEDGIKSKVWQDDGTDSTCFRVDKSMGVAVTEAPAIIRFTYKI
ncbi:MAG: hypothetical protein ACRC45_06395 [Cetobacterium sp.]